LFVELGKKLQLQPKINPEEAGIDEQAEAQEDNEEAEKVESV